MSSDDRDESTARSEAPSEAEDDGVESWLQEAAQISHVSASDPAGRRTKLPAVGSVVGEKYRLEAILGEGGMGAVFRATHTVSDKAVALKWMLRSASDEGARKRFTREARAAGRIDHPNVVDVYDIGQEGDSSYLVMELLHGEPLRERLRREPLGPTEAIDLLVPALRGVAAAHAAGVVHRDLKPDNIFLCRSPDGSPREAKVLDFGISTVTATEATVDGTLTKEGTVLGTPSYMSPEQLRSASDVDQRTDVYSLGVILYEMLSGRVPFKADSYSALVLAIANDAPPPIRESRPEVPRALEKVVLRAMAPDADARYPDVPSLLEALSPFASVPTGSGTHPAVLPAPQPGAKPHLVIATLAVAAFVAVAAWWFSQAAPVAETETQGEGVAGTETEVVAETETVAETVTEAVAETGTEPAAESEAESPEAEPEPEPKPVAAPVPKPVRKVARPTATTRRSAPPPTTTTAPTRKARSGSISVDQL